MTSTLRLIVWWDRLITICRIRVAWWVALDRRNLNNKSSPSNQWSARCPTSKWTTKWAAIRTGCRTTVWWVSSSRKWVPAALGRLTNLLEVCSNSSSSSSKSKDSSQTPSAKALIATKWEAWIRVAWAAASAKVITWLSSRRKSLPSLAHQQTRRNSNQLDSKVHLDSSRISSHLLAHSAPSNLHLNLPIQTYSQMVLLIYQIWVASSSRTIATVASPSHSLHRSTWIHKRQDTMLIDGIVTCWVIRVRAVQLVPTGAIKASSSKRATLSTVLLNFEQSFGKLMLSSVF